MHFFFSIMHYRPEFGQYDLLVDADEFFMQRSLLPSRSDLRKVRKMYGCPLPKVDCSLFPGFTSYAEGLCVRAHIDGKVPWFMGQEICVHEGGRLYEPRDVGHFLLLQQALRSNSSARTTHFWIGASDTSVEGR